MFSCKEFFFQKKGGGLASTAPPPENSSCINPPQEIHKNIFESISPPHVGGKLIESEFIWVLYFVFFKVRKAMFLGASAIIIITLNQNVLKKVTFNCHLPQAQWILLNNPRHKQCTTFWSKTFPPVNQKNYIKLYHFAAEKCHVSSGIFLILAWPGSNAFKTHYRLKWNRQCF